VIRLMSSMTAVAKQGPSIGEGSLRPSAPAWAKALIGEPVRPRPTSPPRTEIAVWLDEGPAGSLCTACVANAAAMSGDELREAASTAYGLIERSLQTSATPHPIRFWNHIPDIQGQLPDGQTRYMAFNAGRFAACCAWFGGIELFDTRVATASGIGHAGSDLVIHCLASAMPGRAVNNPRQIAPYRYSRTYGLLPPCFARGTLLSGPPSVLLVGGTASIVGEESRHRGDLQRQTDETLINLAAVVAAALGQPDWDDQAALLARFRELRVYHRQAADQELLRQRLTTAFTGVRHMEFVHADLCRGELLVEIEGVARL
jgi:chorismate lyase/3-hydroxybenzoate synthase